VQPRLPIWLGGSSASALRRVARIADGFIGSSSSGPAGFAQNWDTIQAHARSIGRDPAAITPAALVYSCVDDDRQRAVAHAEAYGNHYYGGTRSRNVDGMLLGPPEECVRVAQAYFEAGLDTMIIGSANANPATFDRLCSEVLPALRTI
jgi:alkanesulfonate monooxygenase SsuD/methylene tetrahydromethanopterin reductase-like flavin-dependent oxidoreductase (luciferase family)